MYTNCNNMLSCFHYERFLLKKYLGINQFDICYLLLSIITFYAGVTDICRHSSEFLKIFTFTKLAKYLNHCKWVNFFIKLHAAALQTL